MKIVVGVSGASGAVLALETLAQLRRTKAEIHLVVSNGALTVIEQELGEGGLTRMQALAHRCHDVEDFTAPIASGSYGAQAMVVTPCSMRTLGAIAHGLSDSLLTRAADVMLKERRRLVLVTRETPLNEAHLNSMLAVTRMGGMIAPPVPPFYTLPETMDDMVREFAARTLTWLGLDPGDSLTRWTG